MPPAYWASQRCGWPGPLRLVLLLLPPLLSAGLETLHPQPEPTVKAMLEVATWFAIFHVIQLVLTIAAYRQHTPFPAGTHAFGVLRRRVLVGRHLTRRPARPPLLL